VHTVHLYGVITGISTVQPKVYTRRVACNMCGTVQEVMGDAGSSSRPSQPCCELFSLQGCGGSSNWQEDLSGRCAVAGCTGCTPSCSVRCHHWHKMISDVATCCARWHQQAARAGDVCVSVA
jgi:hypothetical protein